VWEPMKPLAPVIKTVEAMLEFFALNRSTVSWGER
jgi:hypothetical protein